MEVRTFGAAVTPKKLLNGRKVFVKNKKSALNTKIL